MKLFVWDFHGVLEKDNELSVIEISNVVLKKHNYLKRFLTRDASRLYGLKWYEYFEYLLPDLSHEKHIELQQECFNFAKENIDIIANNIKPNDHAHAVLEKIRSKGHDQILISNTRPDDLLWFIDAIKITNYFTTKNAFGIDAHRKAASKLDKLKDYLVGKTFDEIIVIGDSQKDIDLAAVIGGRSYYYSHPHATTRKIKADFVINDLRDILKEL